MWSYAFFARRKIMDAYLFVFFFLPRDDLIDPLILEYQKKAHYKVLVPFLSDQIIRGLLGPSHAHFFLRSPDQNFEIVILFSKVEKSNNYVFEDDLIPRSARGKGCEL